MKLSNKSRAPQKFKTLSHFPNLTTCLVCLRNLLPTLLGDICSRKTCRGGFDIQRSGLNDALARTMFRMDNEIYSFSKSGDLETGCDINIWEAAHGNNAESTKDSGMLHDQE